MGGRSTPPASSSACSTAARARPCTARGPRPTRSLPAGHASDWSSEHGQPDPRQARSRVCCWQTAGRVPASSLARRQLPARRRRPDHRHLPRGADAHGRGADAGGRAGEAPAVGLVAGSLARLGFELGRFKTGTPAAAQRRAPSTSPELEPQPGDEPPAPFSFLTERIDHAADRLPHHAHDARDATTLIRANLHRSPMYSGQITGRGPRYCPSIEDKVVRFADRERPPDLPRAGRAWTTDTVYLQRHLDQPAADVQEAMLAHDPRAGAGGDPAVRLRGRVRLRRPARAAPDAGDEARAAGCSSPGRSTAPPATRRRRPRA